MTKKILYSAFMALGIPLLVYAQSGTSTPPTVDPSSKAVCMAAAIEKREQSLIVGHTAFNTNIVQALTARKDSLKGAYALLGDSQKNAKKASWNTFSTASQNAHNEMRKARKAAWATFNIDARACGVAHTETPKAVLNPSVSL